MSARLPGSTARRPIDGSGSAVMVALCLTWGIQQVAIKAVAADIAPTLQIALRSGGSALLVWLYSHLVARDRWIAGGLRPGLIAGALFAAEFLCLGEGLRWTTASHMAVFLYTAPLFAAIGLHLFLPDERLTRVQWAGVTLAFLGIVITFLGPAVAAPAAAASRTWLLGDLMGIAAGAGWGLTTVIIRTSRLSEAPPAQTLFYQLAAAFAVLLPAAAFSGQLTFNGTPQAWASLIFQTVGVSFVSYLIWFWMLRRYLAARLGVLSFMTPLFGVTLGALILHEHLAPSFLAGAALVLAGMLIVNGRDLLRPGDVTRPRSDESRGIDDGT